MCVLLVVSCMQTRKRGEGGIHEAVVAERFTVQVWKCAVFCTWVQELLGGGGDVMCVVNC